MKKTLLIAMLLLASVKLMAQTDGMSYQAVIINPNPQEIPGADATGNILPNKPLSVRFSISDSSGNVEFQETHTTTTDAYGMINLVIGDGSSSVGSFTEIVWDGTQKDLKVEINLDGGYKDLSNQALLFTPYAFHRDIIATGDLTVGGKIGFSGDLEVDGTTILNNTLLVANGTSTNLTGVLNVEGKTTLKDAFVVTNSSPSELSGKLTVLGATELNNTLDVSGATGIKNSLTVSGQNPTALTGTLAVDGVTNLNNTLNVTNGSPVNLSGDLKIGGVLELGNDLTVNGVTNLNKELKVNNQSPTLLTGQLTVEGVTALKDELQVLGNTNLNNALTVTNESPTNLTGTLTVDKETMLNNALTVTNESPTNLTGTLTADGATILNNTLDVKGAFTLGDDLTVKGTTNLNSSLSVNNASPTNLTGKLNVDGETELNNRLTVVGGTYLYDYLIVGTSKPTTLTGTLKVGQAATLNNSLTVANASPTVLTGSLNVAGTIGFGGDLIVDGETILHKTLTVDEETNLNSSLTVNNASSTVLTGSLSVDGATDISNSLTISDGFPAHFTGTFNVDGATIMNEDLTVLGTTTLEDLNLKKIEIKSNNATHVASFENTNNGDGDGIIIKLGKARANDGIPDLGSYDEASSSDISKYTKLLSAGTTAGEKVILIGEITLDMAVEFGKFIAEMAIGVGNLLVTFINTALDFPWDFGLLGSWDGIPLITSFPGLDIPDFTDPAWWGVPNIQFTDIVTNPLSTKNEFISFADKNNQRMGAIKAQSLANWTTSKITPGFIFSLKNALMSSAMDKKHARAHFKGLIKEILIDYKNIGVEYSSGNGDYAEWLERSDPNEFISTGDIVGVIGGKITRDLTNAEQVMAVSERPIVLGNIPEEGKLYLGNNIAFMGQIPVKVMGAVQTGDYIVGKGEIKGYGIAISPKNMTIDDFKTIVGRAWEANGSAGPKMVNTVVGVHNGDYIKILKKYEEKFQESEVRIQSVEAKVDILTDLINKKSL